MRKCIGIVAGGGQFPMLLARKAREMGHKVVVVGLSGHTNHLLAKEVDIYHEIRIGQLAKLIKILREEGAFEVTFAGRIHKPKALWEACPDLKALKLWRSLVNRNDDHILRAVAKELETNGLRVVSPTKYLDFLLTPSGVLTKKAPTKEQWEDIIFGWGIAKAVGELDIGQCVVVKDRAVIAVEAMEGTDATIQRAGKLIKGAVVVKVCKPGQDIRFDLPSVGLETIESMIKAGAKVLAIEAEKSLFFDRERALHLADQADMVVIGIKD